MNQLLKQSTAFTTIVGPILDSTGAEYASAVIGDLDITKNGTPAAMASAATLTYRANGLYILAGTTGNSDTLGRLDITCNKSTYQMPPVRFTVLAATTFDAMVTNAAGASGGMVYNGSNSGTVIPTVTAVGTLTTYTGNTPQTGDSYARLGANGAGLTALGDTRLANLDATISSRGTSTLTQTQVTGGAYTIQSASCVLGDARVANLDVAVSTRGTSTLTQSQVTGGAYSIQSASCVLGDARLANLDVAVSSRGTSTLTQSQVTGGAYTIQSASCVLGDARLANLDVAVSTRGTSTLTQAQVTGGAYSIQNASCVLGDARFANLDVAVSSRGTSTLTQSQVTGGAYTIQHTSCVLGDARLENLDAAVSSVSAGSAPTVEEIDAELSANHGNTAWGAATIYVTPLSATVGIGQAAAMGDLVAYLHGPMPTIVLTITDALNAPVNLSAADLTVIGRLTTNHATLFVLRQTDDQITVSGAGSNIVTINSGVDYGESEGQWELFLQNQNDNGRMLGVGGLTVFDAPLLPGLP